MLDVVVISEVVAVTSEDDTEGLKVPVSDAELDMADDSDVTDVWERLVADCVTDDVVNSEEETVALVVESSDVDVTEPDRPDSDDAVVGIDDVYTEGVVRLTEIDVSDG